MRIPIKGMYHGVRTGRIHKNLSYHGVETNKVGGGRSIHKNLRYHGVASEVGRCHVEAGTEFGTQGKPEGLNRATRLRRASPAEAGKAGRGKVWSGNCEAVRRVGSGRMKRPDPEAYANRVLTHHDTSACDRVAVKMSRMFRRERGEAMADRERRVQSLAELLRGQSAGGRTSSAVREL